MNKEHYKENLQKINEIARNFCDNSVNHNFCIHLDIEDCEECVIYQIMSISEDFKNDR